MAFDPSPAGAAEVGIPVTVGDYASGSAGARQSLDAMALKMREGRLDPAVYAWARRTLADAGLDGRNGFPIRKWGGALLDAIRAQTIYAPDAYGAEVISSAAATLCLRKDLCVRGEDCDGLAVALGSALLSVGIPTVIVKQNYGGENQEHVFIAFQDENSKWIYADPSTNAPLGRSPPGAVSEIWVDPMGAVGDSVGEVTPQIATFGRPPGFGDAAPAAPTSDWQLVTDKMLLDASRYRLGVLINVIGWNQTTVTPAIVSYLFATRYNLKVESATPVDAVTGGMQSWVIQGVATQNTSIPDDSLVTFLAVAVEIPPSIVVQPGGTAVVAAPSSSSSGVSVGAVVVTVAGAALLGGVLYSALSTPKRKRRR